MSSEENEETTNETPEEEVGELLRKIRLTEPKSTYLKDLTPQSVADAITEGKCKRLIVMTGAGISVAAGIPDFRSPETGLYSKLQKYNLPRPEAIFELEKDPQPFYQLAKEMWPGKYKPTYVHLFIKLLHDKGLLLRNFTQNIDTLERIVGLPEDYLVEAHGSFASARCIDCKQEVNIELVKACMRVDQIPKCKLCKGLVKPDIVFFGEKLSERFYKLWDEDFPKCDLLFIIGTSLQVLPFSALANYPNPETPRVLINNELVGMEDPALAKIGFTSALRIGMPHNYRDIGMIGDCQKEVLKLADMLGWKKELLKLYKESR